MLQPTLVTPSRALLTGIIDYAGLFPPAVLEMPAAVAEYREATTGPNAWMVSRFLCPASRLEELAGVLAKTMVRGEAFWSIGVIVDGPLGSSIAAAQAFEAEMAPGASVSAVEVKMQAVASDTDTSDRLGIVNAIADATLTLGEATMSYIEVDLAGDTAADLEAIGSVVATGRPVAGKVRCGGVTADAFPSVEQLASVLETAARTGVALKATAGLHHPIRTRDETLGVEMHGFLNLAVAGHLARSGASPVDVRDALRELDAGAFVFGPASMTWREHRMTARDIQQDRVSGLHGFGSCSFSEPVDDLVAIGVKGVEAS